MKSRANRFVCDCGAMKPRLNTPVLASEFVPDFQRDVLSLKFENDIRWPATVPADAFGVNFNDEGDGSNEAEQVLDALSRLRNRTSAGRSRRVLKLYEREAG